MTTEYEILISDEDYKTTVKLNNYNIKVVIVHNEYKATLHEDFIHTNNSELKACDKVSYFKKILSSDTTTIEWDCKDRYHIMHKNKGSWLYNVLNDSTELELENATCQIDLLTEKNEYLEEQIDLLADENEQLYYKNISLISNIKYKRSYISELIEENKKLKEQIEWLVKNKDSMILY